MNDALLCRAEELVRYFAHFAKTEPSFEPERITAEVVLQLMNGMS